MPRKKKPQPKQFKKQHPVEHHGMQKWYILSVLDSQGPSTAYAINYLFKRAGLDYGYFSTRDALKGLRNADLAELCGEMGEYDITDEGHRALESLRRHLALFSAELPGPRLVAPPDAAYPPP